MLNKIICIILIIFVNFTFEWQEETTNAPSSSVPLTSENIKITKITPTEITEFVKHSTILPKNSNESKSSEELKELHSTEEISKQFCGLNEIFVICPGFKPKCNKQGNKCFCGCCICKPKFVLHKGKCIKRS
ncbi:hypothetical protein Mgra_00007168 [Meloidogyne graminicola]|uniref:TIL domain-containing protein n=1 Tax=Meloidogyne graminicola TaxID=189291 RepID=A0A8S9ZJK3_9BILA|nr:hypothetical protein Mgra_00007168 [Meloidogyne graminicola]